MRRWFSQSSILIPPRNMRIRKPGSSLPGGRTLKHRVELFTDGVYSIAITLLVLELRTPDRPGWAAWGAMLPSLGAYLLTFALTGSAYQLSVIVMRTYREFTPGMFWLLLPSLSMTVLLPLLLKNLVEHMGDPAALMVYLIANVLATVPYTILRYTAPRGCLADPDGWPAYMRQRNRTTAAFWSGLLIAAGLDYVNFWAGFVFYFLMLTFMTTLAARELSQSLTAH